MNDLISFNSSFYPKAYKIIYFWCFFVGAGGKMVKTPAFYP